MATCFSARPRPAQRYAGAFARGCCRRAEARASPRYSRGEAAAAAETRRGVCRGERASAAVADAAFELCATSRVHEQLCAAAASAAAAPPPASRLSRPEGSTPTLPWYRGPEPDSRTVERLRGEALTHTGHAAQGERAFQRRLSPRRRRRLGSSWLMTATSSPCSSRTSQALSKACPYRRLRPLWRRRPRRSCAPSTWLFPPPPMARSALLSLPSRRAIGLWLQGASHSTLISSDTHIAVTRKHVTQDRIGQVSDLQGDRPASPCPERRSRGSAA